MRGALFAFSRKGCALGRKLLSLLPLTEARAYTMERFGEEGFLSVKESSYEEAFHWAQVLIFVGACGIAVRKIAPYVRDKKTDPAVLCVDEKGTFVIPILSGHLGGANDLAGKLAEALDAVPVITTATDINGKFSVDTFAKDHGFAISDMRLAKAVSAQVLEGEAAFFSDFPTVGALPAGLTEKHGELGVYITCSEKAPFPKTLRLIPKILHLGIGCRRGVSEERISRAVEKVLKDHRLSMEAVADVASVDLKKEEAGLLAFCERNDFPVRFYSGEELMSLEGDFTPSEFVRSVTGADNVCERSALMTAHHLVVRKTAVDGVTVAVGIDQLEVRFE